MASTPAWQTDELGEEWVEASPSPPASPEAPPPAAVQTKRGSLRSLGQGAARPLPPSRKGSSASMPEYGRSPSNPYIRSASGMLSPPTSASGSEGDAREREEPATVAGPTVAVAGTFAVKDGEDSHGKAFPRNPFQKDIFAALALEKMFEPPSPPVPGPVGVQSRSSSLPESPSPAAVEEKIVAESSRSRSWSPPSDGSSTPTSDKSANSVNTISPASEKPAPADSTHSSSSSPSTTSSQTPGSERRVSHPYAPLNPSRLSKSVTPSDSSFATTTEATTIDSANASAALLPADDTPTFEYNTIEPSVTYPSDTHDSRQEPETEHETTRGTAHEVTSADNSPEKQDIPVSGREPIANPEYPFTFTAPVPPQRDSPVFDPSLEPLNTGEPSSSTLRRQPADAKNHIFRNGYDTYTREQLEALVDSIAVQPSPSPPAAAPAKTRSWSPTAVDSPLREDSSGNASTPSTTSTTDARSSKRLRLSPPSPRGPTAVRDWRAHGRALMDRIRVTDPEVSATSGSRSGSGSWASTSREEWSRSRSRSPSTPWTDGVSAYDAPTYEYSDTPPPGPAIVKTSPSQQFDQPQQYRSNPSTASSTYLHRAEDMMSRIKSRVVSPSTSTTEASPQVPRRTLSESSGQTYASSEAEQHIPRKDGSMRSTGSRRIVESPSESERSQDMSLEDDSEQDSAPQGVNQRSGSRTSVEGAGPPPNAPNRDDLNRFISASTYMTGTTMSASFVKHPGPRDPTQGPSMTQILPGDVQGVVPDRIGKMRFDRASMRWVRDGNGSLGPVDEAGESRAGGSEESVDVFAGIESMGSLERTRRSSTAPRDEEMEESDTTEDDTEGEVERTPRPLPRQKPQHANTAPPVLKTPTPATPGGPMNVLRSALRNPNSTPVSAIKKQAAWHPDLTPQQARQPSADRSVSWKRSVSFSDGYIAPPREQSMSRRRLSTEENQAPDTTNASWLPSARTRRIQGVLEDMADMSLQDISPSKPARERKDAKEISEVVELEEDETAEVVPFGSRSFRSFRRSNSRRADATFLTECSFGVAHDRLVELITDVQPFEPYWEQLRSIDLSNKGVESLARLKEFLPALDEARLDNNAIDYLSGIPSTVRTLHVAGNQLTSLTSVNHLQNLQYLDISNNHLDSVGQLECLRHLRELKADNNVITSLSGIQSMDSLLKLSVAGNKIERVDLEHTKWDKMESLNLSNNRIKVVTGLHRLKSVVTLNLDKNKLSDLDPAAPLPAVRTLRFSDNDVAHIDLSHFPKVRTLFADNNALPGLSRSLSGGGHRIENLSVRNQRVGCLSLSAEDLQSVKRLYVSGNRLDADFLPRSPLFHLVYLEAAACNLSSWPTRFAERAPNLRILNVNYNFLPDLNGLAGMVLLRKVMVVGNRLGSGGPGATRGLKGLASLEEIDLRMNPSTLSFYLPIIMPGSSKGVPADNNWAVLDAQFRRQLPDEWYSRRLVYRGLIMGACADLKVLDGVKVEDGEKRKAAMLLEYASAASLQ